MYKYIAIEQKLFHPDIGNYTSYGIVALDENENVIVTVDDVSTNISFVVGLANKFTKYQLFPIHLLEVIEDELG